MVMPLLQVIGLALVVLLILLISRRGSEIAKWIFLLLFVAGLAIMAPAIPDILSRGQIGLLQLAQIAVQALALYFLFTPESRAWFKEKRLRTSAPR